MNNVGQTVLSLPELCCDSRRNVYTLTHAQLWMMSSRAAFLRPRVWSTESRRLRAVSSRRSLGSMRRTHAASRTPPQKALREAQSMTSRHDLERVSDTILEPNEHQAVCTFEFRDKFSFSHDPSVSSSSCALRISTGLCRLAVCLRQANPRSAANSRSPGRR